MTTPVRNFGGPAQRRYPVTEIPGPASQALTERRSGTVAAGVGSAMPIWITEGSGGVVIDVDGNSFIDLASGIAVTNVGNSHPRVVEAVTEQAARFTHTCFMVTPYEGYVELCEELAAVTPGDHAKRSALFNSGAEAVENAVKVARHATGRQAVLVFDHGYHGRTNLTMALTAKNMPYKHRFGPLAPEVYRVPTSYPFRDPDGMTGHEAAARALRQAEVQIGAENVAAIVIEPIQGEGGFIVPAPGFLPALSEWCRNHGAVFIADEVQTGFCRTGDWFACDHEGVVPDLVTLAKGIAGGLPLSAVTGRQELMDAVHAGGLGGTFGGNPIACAAALASIDVMRREDLAAAAREIGQIALDQIAEMEARHAAIGDVRGRGAMIAIEIVEPGTNTPDPATAKAVAEACRAGGVVLLTAGTYGNVIRLLPPLVMPEHLLKEGLDILDDGFAKAV
jgi:4-aminobutyrate aminotransferase/(S)-3-amino-2-methylpropionate transaminase